MRIVAYVNANSGPSYHRIIMPLMYMEEDSFNVYITNNVTDEDIEKGCDLFMYNRKVTSEQFAFIKERQKKHGFKICVDVDDYWELDPHHILFKMYVENRFADEQIEHIRHADIVTTTHDRLAELIRPYNSKVHVLPNAIPFKGQFEIVRDASPYTRLFWQGSITHKADIELISRPIEGLRNIASKITMVMAGFHDGEIEWDKIARMYTAQLRHQYKIIPSANVFEYYQAYKHADVCLIPLVNSQFNRCKSNLKVLEAANLGLPVICSQVHPYMDMPVIYAKTGTDWVRNINRLVASKKRQKEAGQELKEFCDEHYNFYKINRERKQILEHAMATT